MKNYLFTTPDGLTFLPGPNKEQMEIENLQVIGISQGRNSKDALKRLRDLNTYLTDYSISKILVYELAVMEIAEL